MAKYSIHYTSFRRFKFSDLLHENKEIKAWKKKGKMMTGLGAIDVSLYSLFKAVNGCGVLHYSYY